MIATAIETNDISLLEAEIAELQAVMDDPAMRGSNFDAITEFGQLNRARMALSQGDRSATLEAMRLAFNDETGGKTLAYITLETLGGGRLAGSFKAASASVRAYIKSRQLVLNKAGKQSEWTWGYTDSEAGVNVGRVRFDGTPTSHERKIGEELASQGLDVKIRGIEAAGPDVQINGRWYDIKELTGRSPRSLQRSIGSARKNFSNDGAANLGLSRSDTRALVDVRGNATWDNPTAVRAEFDRLSRNGDFNNVAEVRVITTNGVVIWIRP